MNDHERRLSLALDALVQLREMLENDCDIPGFCHLREIEQVCTAMRNIEAAAMPKPSIIRRWFGRKEAAA